MLFDEKKYYGYIQTLELINVLIVFAISLPLAILGFIMFKDFLCALMGFLIGLLISSIITINRKIKAEHMKWEIDIYKKIIKPEAVTNMHTSVTQMP